MRDKFFGPLVAFVISCLLSLAGLLVWGFCFATLPNLTLLILAVLTAFLIAFAYSVIKDLAEAMKDQEMWGIFNE